MTRIGEENGNGSDSRRIFCSWTQFWGRDMRFRVFSHRYYFQKDDKQKRQLEKYGMTFQKVKNMFEEEEYVPKEPMGIEVDIKSLKELMRLQRKVDCVLLISPGLICICNEKERYYEAQEEKS
jgi:hypothetical protein